MHYKERWGWTYKKCGFEEVGKTGSGLITLKIDPSIMPKPEPAINMQYNLEQMVI